MQTIYANVDPPGPGEEQEEKTGSYENVKDFVVTSIDLEEDPVEEEGGVYYNLPSDPSRNIEEEEEDETYVYMKSGHNIDQTDVPMPTETVVANSDRKRLQSEPLGKVKKYVNFSNEQKTRSQQPRSVGSRAAFAVGNLVSGGKKGAWLGADNRTASSVASDDEQQPIYENCEQDEVQGEDEEEELYTEVAGLS